ncbi:hypothetical protein P885DRAFT_71935 [Corynascus similis CBS 632.67]
MGHDIITTVNYYDDPGDGSLPIPVYVGGDQVTNERPMVPVTVTVKDVSGQEDCFTLDNHGFQYLNHTSIEKTFDNQQRIRDQYYPECEKLLKTVTGAAQVTIFGHQIRRGPVHWHSISQNNTSSRGPLHRAHVDQSYDGAVIRLHEQFPDPDEAARMRSRRWQIINIWRPITPIRTSPLALADATTVPDADLVAASIFHTVTGRRQESWTVRAGPTHRWYYKHEQTPAEVVLIKCFDSNESAPTRRAVHSAVEYPQESEIAAQEQPGTPVAGSNRESVEVRCLVFY